MYNAEKVQIDVSTFFTVGKILLFRRKIVQHESAHGLCRHLIFKGGCSAYERR